MSVYPPYIIERSSRGERTYDIFSRLLMDRIVFLGAPINDDVANIIIAQLLFLEADNPEKDIYLYLNSPGGVVSSGMAIYDTMQHLRAPVNTICMGMAASMGSFLLSAGAKGKRSALPHSRIMIHQPSGGAQGTASDIEIQAREILYLRAKMNQLYSFHTGQPMPAELVAKLKKASKFNMGFSTSEIVQAMLLDLAWHTLAPGAPPADVAAFEADALKRFNVATPLVPPRYRTPYFAHIWSGGYMSNYYAYMWSEVLDEDAWAWFTEHGGMSRANGQRLRDMILSRGGTNDVGVLYRAFRGRDPQLGPMLEARGLKPGR